MHHHQAAEVAGPGIWLQLAAITDGKCASATPCCDVAVEVPLADLEVIGEIKLHCPTPTGNKRWDLRFDPWAPGREALRID